MSVGHLTPRHGGDEFPVSARSLAVTMCFPVLKYRPKGGTT
jgi:hypothetical protein